MQKIKISTESTADIPAHIAAELGISVLPIHITANGREYRDGESFTPGEFYDILEACEELPSTAQVAPIAFIELYEESWRAGYSEQIHISINAKGSGTYNSAMQAIALFYEEHPEAKDVFRIRAIDSATYSMAYGWAVIEAARMAMDGAGADAIIEACSAVLKSTCVLFAPLNLKYIKKSGRISGFAGFVGDALGMKPVITFENGESRTLAKIRGEKKLIHELIAMVKERIGADNAYILASGSNRAFYEQFRDACVEEIGKAPEIEFPIGSVISINSGHDMVGIIFRT